ncbi:MAG: desulfoferrodoxin [Proteobacteria bacterium]|nr:desulfoferrodoxin [Pseudomonadota bacterium]
MSEKKAIYGCEKCGNVAESLWDGKTEISCCNQTMTKQVPNTVDAAQEKHVPVIVKNGNKVTVKVGDVAHPMTPDHYILFVEVLAGDKVYRHDFKEGDTVAEAVFLIEETDITARAYCNLHGFWQSS